MLIVTFGKVPKGHPKVLSFWVFIGIDIVKELEIRKFLIKGILRKVGIDCLEHQSMGAYKTKVLTIK